MYGRIRILGLVLAVIGLGFVAGGAFTGFKTWEGVQSLAALSEAQQVKLSYNEQGQLVDRGKTEGADAIMALLRDEWKYPVNMADLDPNDPIVNTATEYMYQMATVTYHTLHSTQTVVLPEDVTAADGTVYKAGTYEFPVDGRYWAEFDRSNPIEAKAREQAWTGTAHAIIAELGVGTATATALQLGLAIAALFAGFGFFALVAGLGLVWAVRGATVEERERKVVLQPRAMPA
ncbi:MAG TPA: hypothetical protein VNL94_10075 [Candidatus Binatia bacterium]|nr:hypothetical protein [Candidatus Binatia bacterium]